MKPTEEGSLKTPPHCTLLKELPTAAIWQNDLAVADQNVDRGQGTNVNCLDPKTERGSCVTADELQVFPFELTKHQMGPLDWVNHVPGKARELPRTGPSFQTFELRPENRTLKFK